MTTIDMRVDQYVKLRDLIKAKDDAHKLAMAPYREALEKLNGVMMLELQATGAESVKTSFGTVYQTPKNTASLEDPNAFMRHVIGNGEWELLDRKANAKAVEDFVKTHGVLPPGVKYTSTMVVGVRRA